MHEVTLERRPASDADATRPDVQAFVIECPDWVNVVPLTDDGRVVLVKQYRFGTDRVTYEVPAGVIDASDREPLDAALRELREETGYEAARVELLGSVAPNPAIQSNRCHLFAAHDCRPTSAVAFDEDEDIDVELVTRAEALCMIAEGRIDHALAQVALLRALTPTALGVAPATNDRERRIARGPTR